MKEFEEDLKNVFGETAESFSPDLRALLRGLWDSGRNREARRANESLNHIAAQLDDTVRAIEERNAKREARHSEAKYLSDLMKSKRSAVVGSFDEF